RYPIGNFALRQLSGAAPALYVYLEHAPGRLLIAEGGPKWPGGEASTIGSLLSEVPRGSGEPYPVASLIMLTYTGLHVLSSPIFYLLVSAGDPASESCIGRMHRGASSRRPQLAQA